MTTDVDPEDPPTGDPHPEVPASPAAAQVGLLLERLSQAIGVLILVLALVGIVYTAIHLLPQDLPKKKNPNFIDNIWQSKIMIAAARAAILAVGLYVVASVVAHVISRRWIFQAGPVKVQEVQESTKAALSEAERLRFALSEQLQINAELEERLQARDALLDAILEGDDDDGDAVDGGDDVHPQVQDDA